MYGLYTAPINSENMVIVDPALSTGGLSGPARTGLTSSSALVDLPVVPQTSALVSSSMYLMAKSAPSSSGSTCNVPMTHVNSQASGHASQLERKAKATGGNSYYAGSICYGATTGAVTTAAARWPNSVSAAGAGKAPSWSSVVPQSAHGMDGDRDRGSRGSCSRANRIMNTKNSRSSSSNNINDNTHHNNSVAALTTTTCNTHCNHHHSSKATNFSTGSSGSTFINATTSSSCSASALIAAVGGVPYRVNMSAPVDGMASQQPSNHGVNRPSHAAQLTHSNPVTTTTVINNTTAAAVTMYGMNGGVSSHTLSSDNCCKSIRAGDAIQWNMAKGSMHGRVASSHSNDAGGACVGLGGNDNIVQHLARHFQQKQNHGGGGHRVSHPVVITTSGTCCTSSLEAPAGASMAGSSAVVSVVGSGGGAATFAGQPRMGSSVGRNTHTHHHTSTSTNTNGGRGGGSSSSTCANGTKDSNDNAITVTAAMAAMDRGGMLRNVAPHYTRPFHLNPNCAEGGDGVGCGVASCRNPSANPQQRSTGHVDAAATTTTFIAQVGQAVPHGGTQHEQHMQQLAQRIHNVQQAPCARAQVSQNQPAHMVQAQPVQSQQSLLPRSRVAHYDPPHVLSTPRKPMDCPIIALSVGIMTLYRGINVKYWRRRREARPQTKYNNGYDDKAGFYIPILGEEVVSRYTVQEILGQGSFGIVLRCVDQKYQEQVAMKIIRSGSYFTAQGRLEAEIVAYLNCNPYLENRVVQLRKVFDWQGHVVLVFELLSSNLYQLLKTTCFNGISLDLTRKFAYQLLQVLLQLEKHDPPIIHCDLKPENVVLRDRCRSGLRVIDFGSSCYQQIRSWLPPPPAAVAPGEQKQKQQLPSLSSSTGGGAVGTERVGAVIDKASVPHGLHDMPKAGSNGGSIVASKNNASSSEQTRMQLPKYIQSRFYRSPEVIMELGYTAAIDRWSLGCMLVELHTGVPLFPGRHETDMLAHFTAVLGDLPTYMIETSPKRDLFYCERLPEQEVVSATDQARTNCCPVDPGAGGSDACGHNNSNGDSAADPNKDAMGEVFSTSPLFTVEVGSYTVDEKGGGAGRAAHGSHSGRCTGSSHTYHERGATQSTNSQSKKNNPVADNDEATHTVLTHAVKTAHAVGVDGSGSILASNSVSTNVQTPNNNNYKSNSSISHTGLIGSSLINSTACTNHSTLHDCNTTRQRTPNKQKQQQQSHERFRLTPGTQQTKQQQLQQPSAYESNALPCVNMATSMNVVDSATCQVGGQGREHDVYATAPPSQSCSEQAGGNTTRAQAMIKQDRHIVAHRIPPTQPIQDGTVEKSNSDKSNVTWSSKSEDTHAQQVIYAEYPLWSHYMQSPPPSSVAAVSEKSPRSSSQSRGGLATTNAVAEHANSTVTAPCKAKCALAASTSSSRVVCECQPDMGVNVFQAHPRNTEEKDEVHDRAVQQEAEQKTTRHPCDKSSGTYTVVSTEATVQAHASGMTGSAKESSSSRVHVSCTTTQAIDTTHHMHRVHPTTTTRRSSNEVHSRSYTDPSRDTIPVITTAKTAAEQARPRYVLKHALHPTMCQRMEDILGVHTGGPRGCRRDQPGHEVHSYLIFLDFVQCLLRYDPRERMSCAEALAHPFLRPLLEQEARVAASQQRHQQQQQTGEH